MTENVLTLPEVAGAIESALAAANGAQQVERAIFDLPQGSVHSVAGVADTPLGLRYVTKSNAWYGDSVAGVLCLFDGGDGRLLAVMDSKVVTTMRTAALTSIVIGALRPASVETVGIVGAGRQAHVQPQAIDLALGRTRIAVWDRNPSTASHFAEDLTGLGYEVDVAANADDLVMRSQIVITLTPARSPLIPSAAVNPGTLLIALGADAPGKRELEYELLLRAKLITDVTEACAQFGELQHAIREGALTLHDVHAELGEVLAGTMPGRESEDEVVVFDSTGNAIQDAVAAALMEARCRALGGATIDMTV